MFRDKAKLWTVAAMVLYVLAGFVWSSGWPFSSLIVYMVAAVAHLLGYHAARLAERGPRS